MPRLGGGDIITGNVTINTVNYEPKTPNEIDLPSGMNMPWPVRIVDKGWGQVDITPKIETLKPAGKTYYVDQVNGNDTNAGTSWAEPLKKISTAVAKSDAVVVKCLSGIYTTMGNGPSNIGTDKDIHVCCDDGEATFIHGFRADTRSWTDKTGYWSNSATANPVFVYDTSRPVGDSFFKLTAVTSEAQVASTVDSYWKDSVNNIIYVHGVAQPGANIIFCIGTALSYSNTGTTAPRVCAYTGIRFMQGCSFIITDTDTMTAYFDRCRFIESVNNAFSVTGNVNVYHRNCVASDAAADGYNYHGSGPYHPKVIEVGCIGRNNGIGAGTHINNGSTVHESAQIIRINGCYYGNEGRNVHDVNSAISLNIYCSAFGSADTVNNADFGLAVSAGETCRMYLYRCTANPSSTLNIDNVQPASAKVYEYDCLLPKKTATGIEVWTP